ncbi:MAG TPA: guanylate kinase [Pseudobdellovibrionaceae bacterium]|nr:guanylate kinase [Pseudobdellovibrionaceae bacterium]
MNSAGKAQPTSGPMIIIAAPSGAGKSSFVERICREMPVLVDTVTYTTRAMRAGESEGQPYHFVTREDFERKISEGFFVEWAHVHTNMYGTPLHQLVDAWRDGKVIIMDVDVQGAATFKAKYPSAVSIFILPPSIEELRRRVTKRDGGAPRDLDVRMKNAEREIALAPGFDHRIINDEFESSYSRFKKLVESIIQGG